MPYKIFFSKFLSLFSIKVKYMETSYSNSPSPLTRFCFSLFHRSLVAFFIFFPWKNFEEVFGFVGEHANAILLMCNITATMTAINTTSSSLSSITKYNTHQSCLTEVCVGIPATLARHFVKFCTRCSKGKGFNKWSVVLPVNFQFIAVKINEKNQIL